ncbi:EF-hand domain-containing protein [Microvirga puerhi]|uniref:EF-hand domain-containing protein n=1 Tax=Microvirga puerhi TaxID=2876078 RepID=A0ABS7VIU4_9HYPH|nr:EF-hand domain-containing protein [Microvirga puerhi]MBZ6074903.1 EF-hand domain-containing protein [Microvirga puerhi]
MTSIALRYAAFAALVIAGLPTMAAAQTSPPAATTAPGMTTQGTGTQPGTMIMMHPSMMGRGMMDQGMMGPPAPMMKIMFAIADTNGDGALSFDEVTAIHKRIFDRIDANKDGKITIEEVQAFFRD